MPRKRPPQEDGSFEEVYLDETSQTGHRFLVIGGIVIPQLFSERFEHDILEARRPRLAAERSGSAELREIGWKKVGNGDFEAYKRVVDAYFDFAGKHLKSSDGTVEFHCSVVNTHIRGRAFSGQRGKVGFSKEVFFHCMGVARYHKKKLFHIYLDERETDKPVDLRLRNMLCRRLKKERDRREWPVRRVKSKRSHDVQALQVADLLIGAVAFRLNRHYDADAANADKKQLCEYILRKGGAWESFGEKTFRQTTVGRFQIWVRRPKEAASGKITSTSKA